MTDHDVNNERVNRPSHYTRHPSGVECIEIARLLPGALSHAMTYIWRAGLKIDREAWENARDTLGINVLSGYKEISDAAAHYSCIIDLQKAVYWLRDYIANYQPVLAPARVAMQLTEVAKAEEHPSRRVAFMAMGLLMHENDAENHVLAHDLVERLLEWIEKEKALVSGAAVHG